MSDLIRLSGKTCLTLAELKEVIRDARLDGRYTADEEDRIDAVLDYAYYLSEEAEGVNALYEFSQKHGVEAMLNRPNREKVVSVMEFRLRMEAKRKAMSAGDYSPDIA